MKILFNEITPESIFSALRALGVTCFFNIVAPGGGGSSILNTATGNRTLNLD